MFRRPKEKQERSLGMSLGVKATRSSSPKAAILRKPYKPGQHGKGGRVRALSDFGRQLKEKRRVKVAYGLNELALRHAFATANRQRGSTSTKLMELLESRIDNVVYRMGFAGSRSQARQAVVQGHIVVNGRRTFSPAHTVSVGDTIAIRKESMGKGQFKSIKEASTNREYPSWLQVEADKMQGKMIALPELTDIPFEISLLVESFSK